MRFVQTIGWLASLVYGTIPLYWLVVHPRAGHWGRRHRAPLTVLGPIWFAMWLAAGTATWSWRHVILYRASWTWAAAGVLFALGLATYRAALKSFSPDQVLGRSELQPQQHEQRLVCEGIRRRVRHPLYLGHLLELAAWAVGTGLAAVYVMLAVGIVTGTAMIRWEEKELQERFGEAYREYRRSVPAIVPSLRLRFWRGTNEKAR